MDDPSPAPPSPHPIRPGDVVEFRAAVRGEGWRGVDDRVTSPSCPLWWGDSLLVLSLPHGVSGRLLVTSLRSGGTFWVHDTWLDDAPPLPGADPLLPWDWSGP